MNELPAERRQRRALPLLLGRLLRRPRARPGGAGDRRSRPSSCRPGSAGIRPGRRRRWPTAGSPSSTVTAFAPRGRHGERAGGRGIRRRGGSAASRPARGHVHARPDRPGGGRPRPTGVREARLAVRVPLPGDAPLRTRRRVRPRRLRGGGRARARGVRALRRAVGRSAAQARPAVPASTSGGGNPLDLVPTGVGVPVPCLSSSPTSGPGCCARRSWQPTSAPPSTSTRRARTAGRRYLTPPPSLADVLRRAIEVLGPERILFGTDSSFFPRGWQRPIHEAQMRGARRDRPRRARARLHPRRQLRPRLRLRVTRGRVGPASAPQSRQDGSLADPPPRSRGQQTPPTEEFRASETPNAPAGREPAGREPAGREPARSPTAAAGACRRARSTRGRGGPRPPRPAAR